MTRSNAALATPARDVLPHPWLAERASEAASSLALRSSDRTVGEMKGSRSRACFRVVGPRAVGRLVGRGCRPREGRAKGSREGASQSAGRRNRGMAGAGAQHLPPANIGTVPSPSKTDGDKRGEHAERVSAPNHVFAASAGPSRTRHLRRDPSSRASRLRPRNLADANTESDAGHIADMYIGIIQLLVCPVCIPSRVR